MVRGRRPPGCPAPETGLLCTSEASPSDRRRSRSTRCSDGSSLDRRVRRRRRGLRLRRRGPRLRARAQPHVVPRWPGLRGPSGRRADRCHTSLTHGGRPRPHLALQPGRGTRAAPPYGLRGRRLPASIAPSNRRVVDRVLRVSQAPHRRLGKSTRSMRSARTPSPRHLRSGQVPSSPQLGRAVDGNLTSRRAAPAGVGSKTRQVLVIDNISQNGISSTIST